jgi:putative N6-adenine-specific DNA methylase
VCSALSSVPDCQRIIKKAIAVRLGQRYGLETLPETGVKYQISFNILNDACAVYIDTTGESLHKRGYRTESNLAPIRETLAAAMVYLSKRRGDRPLCDPMCGSGTILIEVALIASNTAPGLKRSFALEEFAGFDKSRMDMLRAEAREKIVPFDGPITGSDIDPLAVEIAISNAKRANLAGKIKFACAPLHSADLPGSGIIITNPPYGERMGDIKTARELYSKLGELTLKKGLGAYVISPDEEFERFFGRRADKKRKLYNGMIKCYLYMYR